MASICLCSSIYVLSKTLDLEIDLESPRRTLPDRSLLSQNRIRKMKLCAISFLKKDCQHCGRKDFPRSCGFRVVVAHLLECVCSFKLVRLRGFSFRDYKCVEANLVLFFNIVYILHKNCRPVLRRIVFTSYMLLLLTNLRRLTKAYTFSS